MKAIVLLNLVFWSFLFITPCAYAAADIEVTPLLHDFGEVDLGQSETVLIRIRNVGDSTITINNAEFATASSSDYTIAAPPYFPAFFSAGGSITVQITFTPSASAISSAVLEITSTDPDDPITDVTLTGRGVSPAVTPLEQIQAAVEFMNSAVTDKTLLGTGKGSSAGNRLNAWSKKIEKAESLITEESYEQACELLNVAYKQADGRNKPPDFVTGSAAPELAAKILELMETLECD